MPWNLIRSGGKGHITSHGVEIHWLEFYCKRYENDDRHTGAITYRCVPWCFSSEDAASSCLYSFAICLDLSVSVFHVFIQIKIQETSENISSLSFTSNEKLLKFAKLQSLQQKPCKCNEKAKPPQLQVPAFTAIWKNHTSMRLFVHGLICSFLMLGTGSIVYSFAKLLTMKELFSG